VARPTSAVHVILWTHFVPGFVQPTLSVSGEATRMGWVLLERRLVLSERLSIELQACDRARNRYRRWHVTAGQDLFGYWHARVTFGRIGCDGRTIRHDFVNENDAATFIRACLHRRATAEKRLSIRYRVIEASPTALPLLRIVGLQERPCSEFAQQESLKGLEAMRLIGDWPPAHEPPTTKHPPFAPGSSRLLSRPRRRGAASAGSALPLLRIVGREEEQCSKSAERERPREVRPSIRMKTAR
jgi:hypothetical protein